MIKLVTQFDDSRVRASLATPTCGSSSCCCCCCLATTLTSSTYTFMNLGNLGRARALPNSQIIGRRVLGVAALPIGLGIMILVAEYTAPVWAFALAGIASYLGLLWFAYHSMGFKTGLTSGILTIIAGVAEFYGAAYLVISNSDAGYVPLIAYFIIAVGAPIVLARYLAHRQPTSKRA